MTVVTVHQAKTQLSKLIVQAMSGEDVVIANGATPKVRLTPVNAVKKRQFGALKGVVSLDDSFFEPLPADELAAWGET
jgi:prevent-host-death family protein